MKGDIFVTFTLLSRKNRKKLCLFRDKQTINLFKRRKKTSVKYSKIKHLISLGH
jgi:hypothetical protein